MLWSVGGWVKVEIFESLIMCSNKIRNEDKSFISNVHSLSLIKNVQHMGTLKCRLINKRVAWNMKYQKNWLCMVVESLWFIVLYRFKNWTLRFRWDTIQDISDKMV